MHLIAIGLNAGSAPLALRERLAFSPETLPEGLAALRSAMAGAGVAEGLILSTCHRLECYAVAPDAEAGRAMLARFLSAARDVPITEFMPHLVVRYDDGVVEHLFRLAAGLASPVLGDSQIVGQISDAYAAAQRAGAAGPVLAALFQRAIHAAKRVHSETTLNRRVSVGYAAAAVALRSTHIAHPSALIVGAGQMAQRAAWYLRKHDAGRILIANRSAKRGRDLAARVKGEVVAWERLAEAFADVDILISATAATDAVVRTHTVHAAMRQRPTRCLVCVDLAVPRDIEPDVAAIPGVCVVTVDDLAEHVDADHAKRQADIPRAEAIIAEGAADFAQWRAARGVTPLISALRDEAERIRTAELRRYLQRDGAHATDAERLDALTRAIVNKLLHHPTVRLKEMSSSPEHDRYAAIAGDLFGIDRPVDSRQ